MSKTLTYEYVILAGGQNKRLERVMPAFFKPMITVNGRTLIGHLLQAIYDTEYYPSHRTNITIVCAPENARMIVDLTEACAPAFNFEMKYIIQPSPRGPGEALYRALEATVADFVIVLCADNTLSGEDLSTFKKKVREVPLSDIVVGGRCIPIHFPDEAQRFTRMYCDSAGSVCFAEGSPIYDHQLWEDTAVWRCWIGPLKVPCKEAATVLRANRIVKENKELKIGPHLQAMLYKAAQAHFVELCSTSDIGTVDAFK